MSSSVNPANNSRHNRSHQEKTEKGDKDICKGSSSASKTRDGMGKSEERAKKHDSVSGEYSEEDPEGDASKLAIESVEGRIHNTSSVSVPFVPRKSMDDRNAERPKLSDGGHWTRCLIPSMGIEFVRRLLRHVLSGGRSIRDYGICHPTAKANRLCIRLHTGLPVDLGAPPPLPNATSNPPTCPCCGAATHLLL